MKVCLEPKKLIVNSFLVLLVGTFCTFNSIGMESKPDTKTLKAKVEQAKLYVIPGIEKEKASFDAAAKALLPISSKPQPKGDVNSWYASHQDWVAARNKYQSALTAKWVKVSGKDVLREQVEREIAHVMIHPHTGRKYSKAVIRLAFEANESLIRNKLSKQHTSFLLKVMVPDSGVRSNDTLSALGITTEPWGWEIQQCHVLVLLRHGDKTKAEKEIKKLHRKVDQVYKKSPNGRLDYDRDLGDYRYKSIKQYQIETLVIMGLIKGHRGEFKTAEKHIAQARSLAKDGKLGAELEVVVNEINTLKQKSEKK